METKRRNIGVVLLPLFLFCQMRIIEAGCTGSVTEVMISTKHPAYIGSPSYPVNYSNNLHCTWFIHTKGYRGISLYFYDAVLQQRSGLTCLDYVAIYVGKDETGDLTEKLCGDFTSEKYIYNIDLLSSGEGDGIFLVFNTDSSITERGFLLQINAEENEVHNLMRTIIAAGVAALLVAFGMICYKRFKDQQKNGVIINQGTNQESRGLMRILGGVGNLVQHPHITRRVATQQQRPATVVYPASVNQTGSTTNPALPPQYDTQFAPPLTGIGTTGAGYSPPQPPPSYEQATQLAPTQYSGGLTFK